MRSVLSHLVVKGWQSPLDLVLSSDDSQSFYYLKRNIVYARYTSDRAIKELANSTC